VDVSAQRNDLMRVARKTLGHSAAQDHVYAELHRLYPPEPRPTVKPTVKPTVTPTPGQPLADAGTIRGLGDLPDSWPDLPAQSSLLTDVAWVQSNRLLIVEDGPGTATTVRLARAAEPAPSRAALSWLETAIRSYAKFVDVVARSAGGTADAEDDDRRERLALGEIDELLVAMAAPQQT
jgi:hypothetical protein